MNILAINGSRRKQGNTSLLLEAVLHAAEQAGAVTESIHLGDYRIAACTGCEGCRNSWDCVIKDDFADLIIKLDEADGVVLGSPTYWYTVTSDMKRFLDRCYSLLQFPHSRQQWISKYQGRGKVCVTVAVCEQPEESMMGNTLILLSDFSRDIGLDLVDAIAGLNSFEAGIVKNDRMVLRKAGQAGRKMTQYLEEKRKAME